MTAYRPPRGGKPEGSGEKEKLVPRFDNLPSLPSAIFRKVARIALAPESSSDRPLSPDFKSNAAAVTAQEQCVEGPLRPAIELDDAASGRADATFQFEFDKWQRIIDAALRDKGLSRDQRAAAVVAFRIRQQTEAAGARKRVMDEEMQKARTTNRRFVILQPQG